MLVDANDGKILYLPGSSSKYITCDEIGSAVSARDLTELSSVSSTWGTVQVTDPTIDGNVITFSYESENYEINNGVMTPVITTIYG